MEHKGEQELAELLKDAKCVISETSTFSRKRWDAVWTAIYFYVPLSELKKVNSKFTDKLVEFCDQLMPKEAGLDVMHVEFLPLIESGETVEAAIADVEHAATGLSKEIIARVLPPDIKQKGKDMASVYSYLYCVENSLRLFVEDTAKSKFGEHYLKKLVLNREMMKKISTRKAQAAKTKWLPARGESDIFYLDFDDLGDIVRNNWSLFKKFFPGQNWITTKIDELTECRNLVAHNSYLEEHQRNVVKVNYTSILMQLASAQREKT